MNVISALMDIAADPVTRDGKATTPITYDSNCLEEVCGSCAMLINGKARMACSALIDNLEQPIRLEPFSKFPVVRDLAIDRSVLFENLKAVKAWVPIDGTYDLGAGPRMSPEEQEAAYPLSRCISCCCCMEACPQFNERHGLRRGSDDLAGSAVQHASHGQGAKARTPGGADGRWRHPGMRLCPELRRGLPQGHSANQVHFRSRRAGHETGPGRFIPTLGYVETAAIGCLIERSRQLLRACSSATQAQPTGKSLPDWAARPFLVLKFVI